MRLFISSVVLAAAALPATALRPGAIALSRPTPRASRHVAPRCIQEDERAPAPTELAPSPAAAPGSELVMRARAGGLTGDVITYEGLPPETKSMVNEALASRDRMRVMDAAKYWTFSCFLLSLFSTRGAQMRNAPA